MEAVDLPGRRHTRTRSGNWILTSVLLGQWKLRMTKKKPTNHGQLPQVMRANRGCHLKNWAAARDIYLEKDDTAMKGDPHGAL